MNLIWMTNTSIQKIDGNLFETTSNKFPENFKKHIKLKIILKYRKEPYIYKGEYMVLNLETHEKQTKLILQRKKHLDITIPSKNKGICAYKKDVADYFNYNASKQSLVDGFWYM